MFSKYLMNDNNDEFTKCNRLLGPLCLQNNPFIQVRLFFVCCWLLFLILFCGAVRRSSIIIGLTQWRYKRFNIWSWQRRCDAMRWLMVRLNKTQQKGEFFGVKNKQNVVKIQKGQLSTLCCYLLRLQDSSLRQFCLGGWIQIKQWKVTFTFLCALFCCCCCLVAPRLYYLWMILLAVQKQ